MLKALLEVAELPDDPLRKLSRVMSWHLEFSPSDVLEMKKFLKIMSPMERLFRQLNSEKDSTLHMCYPIVKVGHRSHIL